MTHDFDFLPNRRDTECEKWGTVEEEVLPMWVADMDFQSPEPVIRALHERVHHGVFGYPLPPAGLEEAIVAWISKRHDWDISPEDIVLLPGVVAGFNLAAHAVTRPGDGALIQTPAYGPFFDVARNASLIQQTTTLSTDQQGQYIVDIDEFKSSITGRSRIFMLCNPQNPTGRVFRKHELEEMADICLKNNLIICSDEIHNDIVYSGNKHIPIASLSPEIAANTITLMAPSKTFNLAGLKSSFAVITNGDLRRKFDHGRKGLLGSTNLLGLYALLEAYQSCETWLDDLLDYLELNRDLLYDFVNNHLAGIHMVKPEGTFLGWLDCREAYLNGSPRDFFLEQAKVLMNDGEWFGEAGTGFVRLNFGCPRQVLAEALTRIKVALLRRKETSS